MKLSLVERLVLANQFKILEHLTEAPEDKENCRARIEVLEQGFEGEYSDALARAFSTGRDVVSEEDCDLVHEILTMFGLLSGQFHGLQGEAPNDYRARFRGFHRDHPDERRLYRYAVSLRSSGRYQELSLDDLRGSGQHLDEYKRQLAAWNASADKTTLSDEDVRRIVLAAKPE